MWKTKRIFSILAIVFTLLFIGKVILEMISCMWIVKEIMSLGGIYSTDDYRIIVNELGYMCKISLIYAVFMLIYSICKFKM